VGVKSREEARTVQAKRKTASSENENASEEEEAGPNGTGNAPKDDVTDATDTEGASTRSIRSPERKQRFES
jgi:hypothetical protein